MLVSCGGESQKQKDSDDLIAASQYIDKASARPWKVLGNQGNTQFIFVEPDKVHDRVLMAQILQAVVGQKSGIRRTVEVLFFNKESETPAAFPMTDSQMLHQVAQYNYNPNNGFEEFVWIIVADSKTSPPTLSTKKDNISPGIAR